MKGSGIVCVLALCLAAPCESGGGALRQRGESMDSILLSLAEENEHDLERILGELENKTSLGELEPAAILEAENDEDRDEDEAGRG